MDVVTYGADAKQFFDVHQMMQAAANRTSGTLGEASLRSERIVSRSSANIVTGLFQSQNAAEALANSFLNLEHATVIGLGAAVAVSVGVALFEGLQKARDKAFELSEEVRKVIASASGPASYSTLDALSSKLAAIREEQKKLQDEANSPFTSLVSAIAAHPQMTPFAAVAAQNSERSERTAQLAKSELDTLDKMSQKMGETADLEATRLHFSEATAAMDKLDVEYQEQRAALIRGPGQNLQAVSQLDRLHALKVSRLRSEASLGNDSLAHARELADIERRGLGKRDETIAKLTSELAYRLQILKAAQRLGEIKGIAAANVGVAQAKGPVDDARRQLFQDVATGKALADYEAEKIARAQQETGERIIAEFRADRANRVNLGPAALAELDKADKLDKASAAGLSALGGKDFSGLAALGNLPFSGLQSLDGLTITIQ
jgi:hypothetical protein